MRKSQFLDLLKEKLKELPPEEVEERLSFYSEMIDDRMEEGLSEEEAVAAIGTVDRIAAQILAEAQPEKQKVIPKWQLKTWQIVLLVLGSPLWVSLLIAAVSVAVSVYVSLWAVFGSLIGCALGGIIGGAVMAATVNGFAGMALIGGGIACAGLSILLFFGCKAATKGLCLLVKKVFTVRREAK